MKKSALLAAVCVPAFLAAAPLAAKTLVYCSEGSPENFYPGVNTTGTSFDVTEQIYDNIVDFERGGTKVVPGLAEKWDISADGTVYTFHIRKNAKWHTNKNFKPTRNANADDIVFMLERQWKEDNPYFKVTSPNHSYFSDMGMPKLLKSVEKVDDYTVKITLNQPEAPFLSNLAMECAGVQSKEYADAMMKAGTPEKIDQEPIGTGPYSLVQYQKDAIIRYKAFPEYWGGKAKIDDLVFAITPDASVRWAKLQKGECHVMPYPNPADLEAMKKDPNVQILEQAGLNIGYLAYQTTKKPFDDVRVRKAFNMAMNKKAIVDAVFLGSGMPAKNPIPPSMWSYNDAVKEDPYDPEAAKKLLAEAGYPEWLRNRPVGDAGAASLQPERAPHRGIDAGRPRQDRRQGRDQELRMGRVSQARSGGRAPDGSARLDRRQRRSGQLPAHPARLRVGTVGIRLEHRQVVLQAVRRSRGEGQGRHQRGGAHQALRAGSGDLQGAGSVVHRRSRGAAEADPQGSRRLQDLAVRSPHLLRRGHQG